MKANELRIVNYIEKDGNLMIVERLSFDNISCDIVQKAKGQHVNSGRLIPIPLTEEWLLKFGFDKYEFGFNKFGLSVCWVCGGFGFSNGQEGTKDYIFIPLPYVHTLQKLYFALTGEELTIKN